MSDVANYFYYDCMSTQLGLPPQTKNVSYGSAITSLSPTPKTPVLPAAVGSPAKSIDNRSKCYKQLNELNGLKMAGVLSVKEFDAEKTLILNVLKKLT